MGNHDKPDATETYPDGRVCEEDEGRLTFGLGIHPEKKLVVVNFTKPVHWLAMTPEQAEDLADLLRAKAAIVRKTQAPREEGHEG